MKHSISYLGAFPGKSIQFPGWSNSLISVHPSWTVIQLLFKLLLLTGNLSSYSLQIVLAVAPCFGRCQISLVEVFSCVCPPAPPDCDCPLHGVLHVCVPLQRRCWMRSASTRRCGRRWRCASRSCRECEAPPSSTCRYCRICRSHTWPTLQELCLCIANDMGKEVVNLPPISPSILVTGINGAQKSCLKI